jgi:hypothetical protein
LTAKGYGETKLLNRCKDGVKCSEEEHQVNRRTEFRITSTTFVPAVGSPEFKAPKIESVDEDTEIETDVEEIKRDNLQVDPKSAPVPPAAPAEPAPAKPTPAAAPAPAPAKPAPAPAVPAKPKK